MTKQALPAVSVLSPESIEEFKTQDKVVVVAYFDAEDKTSNTTFSEIAETMRDDYLFGATNDAKLAKAEGIKQPGIVLFKSFDEGKDTFDGKFEKEAITKFTKEAATPLVGEVGPETYAGYMAVSAFRKNVATKSANLTIGRTSPSLHLRRNRRRAQRTRRNPQTPRQKAQGRRQFRYDRRQSFRRPLGESKPQKGHLARLRHPRDQKEPEIPLRPREETYRKRSR